MEFGESEEEESVPVEAGVLFHFCQKDRKNLIGLIEGMLAMNFWSSLNLKRKPRVSKSKNRKYARIKKSQKERKYTRSRKLRNLLRAKKQ